MYHNPGTHDQQLLSWIVFFSSSRAVTYCLSVIEKWIHLTSWEVDHCGNEILEYIYMADNALSIYFPSLTS